MQTLSRSQAMPPPPPPLSGKTPQALRVLEPPRIQEPPCDAGAAPVAALEMVQLKAQLAEATAALDGAVAKIADLRRESDGHQEQVGLERRVAAAFSKRLSASQKELETTTSTAAELRSERDAALAEVAALQAKSAQPGASQTGADQAEWEARATSRFEEDIETYRKRIQTLLGERDALRAENERLSASVAAPSAADQPIA